MLRVQILNYLFVSLVTISLAGCALAVADKYFEDKETSAAEESSASDESQTPANNQSRNEE